MSDTLIWAQGATKAFGSKTVLRDIDLAVGRSECVAFIGHNGCGKSTLLKVLAGLAVLTSGTVARGPGVRIAYVPEYFPRMDLTAAQYILHMGRVEGIPAERARAAGSALFDDFFLRGLVDTPMKHLSKGTLQKVGVVQALLAPHDVLLLDEPLSGQDIASQRVFVQKAAALRAAGTTLLLSCHEPFLVNRLATRVYEIQGGALHPVMAGDRRLHEMDRLELAAPAGMPLPTLPDGCAMQEEDGRLVIEAPAGESQALLRALLEAGYQLRGFYHEQDL